MSHTNSCSGLSDCQALHSATLCHIHAVVVVHSAGPGAAASKCYGLDIPQDGSVIIACKSCVFQLGSDGAPSGKKFCPNGENHALKHVALDPSNKFFYVADTVNKTVHKVSLQTWKVTGNFTVPRNQKVHGLLVLTNVDQAAVQAGRKKAEQDWLAAVSVIIGEIR